MITLNDIKIGLWLIKNENTILTLSVKPTGIWQIIYHIKHKKHKAIVYQKNQLYESDQKTIINDEQQITSFINRTKKILNNNPYWSIICTKSELDQSIKNTHGKQAIEKPKQKQLSKFSQLVTQSNDFTNTTFYKDQALCTAIINDLIQQIQIKKQPTQPSTNTPTTISMDQFQTAIDTSTASDALNKPNETAHNTYDFSKVKEIYDNLISEIGEGKPAIKITSNNNALDYKYIKLVNTEKLIFIKSTDYTKKQYELDFNNGTITINQQLSSDEADKKTLSKLIKQAGGDLEKNLAAVEAVDRLEVE